MIRTEEGIYDKKVLDRAGEGPQVRGARAESLRAMWPAAGLYAPLRTVPDLLPGTCVEGRDPWCQKGELVSSIYRQDIPKVCCKEVLSCD